MLWHTGEDKMIKGFILSLQFLTRIPININIEFSDKNIASSIFFYPLVGAIIGGIAGLTYQLFLPLGIEFSAFFALLMVIILTGGLHLDGLADTLDGFLSSRDRDRTLEIMKDSRIGAFGVIGLILILLLKYITFLKFLYGPMALTLSLANSRLTVIVIMATKRIARPGGLGEMNHRNCKKTYVIASAFLYCLVVILINPIYLIPLLVSYITGELISQIAYKKIDGLTGDVYGAIIEIGESLSLLGFLGVNLWI